MSLHWYACISTNTCCFEMHHISLETDWWALSNASSIIQIQLAIYNVLADKAFTATDGLISQLFVVTFVPPTYVRIALIWGFPAQLSLWKSVHWLWRYKLNEVCDSLLKTWMCTMDEATLFLTLTSVIMGALRKEVEKSTARASSCWIWDLKEGSLLLLKEWKENWLENISLILFPGWSSRLIGSKAENTLLNLLSMLMTLFNRPHCLLVSILRDRSWGGEEWLGLLSNSDLMMWFVGRVCPLSWDLPLSFWRCRRIGIRPAIASMPYKEDVLNAPKIHVAALL